MSVGYYHGLLADEDRIQAFRRAIEAQVQPGDTVLEIGSGLGTYSFFAARAGASCVWAVDGNPIIHVAETVARVNGMADVVRCLRGWIPEVDLPTPVDVIIFEDFATRLFDVRTYRTVRDAIAKYLVPGGRLIPGEATVYVAPLSSLDVRGRLFPLDALKDSFDIDWSPTHDYMRNAPTQHWLSPDSLGGDPRPLYTARMPPLPSPEEMSGSLTWQLDPGTTVYALGLWFDLELGEGGTVSNGPARKTGPWGQMALPLDPPVVVDPTGLFVADVDTDPTADGAPGWLRWKASSGSASAEGHEFAAAPASLDDLFPDGVGSEP